MKPEPDNFKIMDVLQGYVNSIEHPPPIVTGFTLIMELTDQYGANYTITATAPHDSISKTLGHLNYMETRAKQQMNDDFE